MKALEELIVGEVPEDGDGPGDRWKSIQWRRTCLLQKSWLVQEALVTKERLGHEEGLVERRRITPEDPVVEDLASGREP